MGLQKMAPSHRPVTPQVARETSTQGIEKLRPASARITQGGAVRPTRRRSLPDLPQHERVPSKNDEDVAELRRENEELKQMVRSRLRGTSAYVGGAQFRSGAQSGGGPCPVCAKLKQEMKVKQKRAKALSASCRSQLEQASAEYHSSSAQASQRITELTEELSSLEQLFQAKQSAE